MKLLTVSVVGLWVALAAVISTSFAQTRVHLNHVP